ncbi:MAG: 4Fe-4S binding protein [Alistipes sp.]
MKKQPNYLKHVLQWGVLAAIVGTILWAKISDKPVDVEAYCPFGGLQAFGTYLVRNSLACSMSMLQIMMGLVLAVGVILFSKLFCGYLCPLGTVGEWLGKGGKKLHLQVEIPSGSVVDKILRVVKYVLLFTILYFTFTSSELFCKRLDPYYAIATGFKGEIVMWMALSSIALLFLGSVVVKMFWCRYICPLGAVSNIFKFTMIFLPAVVICWALSHFGIEGAWMWVIAATCAICYIVEIVKMRSCVFPLLAITRDEDACNHCGLCEKRCPYNIPIGDFSKVKHVDCTMCGTCISSCATGALKVNRCKGLRWLPALLAVALFFVALWAGSKWELPTIDEQWGDYEQVEQMETFEMEGLKTIKCFGSSKAFSAKMQNVPGVYGVKTYVKRYAAEIRFDPTKTDTLKIQEAIFSPTMRKYHTPEATTPLLDVIHLGVEGLHDRMDMVYFGMILQKVEGVYGFVSEFACPVKVLLYVDPAAGITEAQLEEVIDAKELVMPAKDADKIIPLHFVLKEYASEGTISREEFVELMFTSVAKMGGKFTENQKKWGDDVAFPKAVYQMAYPGIEKMPIRAAFPYFKSFLSCSDGIVSAEFVLNELVPTLQITYVKSMWDDARLWKEIFNAEKWTLRMADGTFKDSDPKLAFRHEGKTLDEVPAVK